MGIEGFLGALVVGLVVGLLSGMLGIGGGTVMVPVFRLGFGMSALEATATSLFTIIPTSLAGCITHVKNKTCLVSLGLAAGVGGAITSPLGVWLAHISPPWAIMLAAGIVIVYASANMLIKAAKMKSQAVEKKDVGTVVGVTDTRANAAAQTSVASASETLSRKQLFVGFLIGLGAGVISGYVGVGGGFIMVPLFLSFIGISMKKASGSSLVAVTLLAIPGAIEQVFLGNVSILIGVAMAVGSIPGAMIGAQFVKYVPERMLRFIFGCFLVVMAVFMVLNEVVLIS